MFQFTKRTLIAAVVAAAMTAPPAAYARINLDPQAPTASGRASSTNVPRTSGVQASSNRFDWADAGIGAGVTVALMGAGTGMVIGRRRQGRHAATS
jgi:hypothetical protein